MKFLIKKVHARFICLSFLLLAIDCRREICFPAHFEVPSLECPQEPARPLWGSPALFEDRSLRCRLRTSTLWDCSLAHLKVPRTFTLTEPFVHPNGIGQSPVGTVRSSLCLSLYITVIDYFIEFLIIPDFIEWVPQGISPPPLQMDAKIKKSICIFH